MALCVKLLTGGEHDLPSIQVAFFRSFLCLLLMVPSLMMERQLASAWSRPLLMRSLAGGLAMIAYFQAIDRLSLANAVMLNYTSPLWASLFAWLLLNERLSPAVLLAYPLALSGIIMVVGAPGAVTDPAGFLLALLSAVLAGAAYTALRGLRHSSPTVVVGALCALTSLLTAPMCWACYQAPTLMEWVLLWTCAGASFAAQFLLTLGYRWSTTASASTVGMATVGTTWVLAWLVLGESLSAHQISGVLLLLVATSQTSPHSFLGRLITSLLPKPRAC